MEKSKTSFPSQGVWLRCLIIAAITEPGSGAGVRVWRPEDELQELILSFHCVSLEDHAWAGMCGGRQLFLLRHLS